MFQEKKTAIDLLMVMVEKNVNKKQEFFFYRTIKNHFDLKIWRQTCQQHYFLWVALVVSLWWTISIKNDTVAIPNPTAKMRNAPWRTESVTLGWFCPLFKLPQELSASFLGWYCLCQWRISPPCSICKTLKSQDLFR